MHNNFIVAQRTLARKTAAILDESIALLRLFDASAADALVRKFLLAVETSFAASKRFTNSGALRWLTTLVRSLVRPNDGDVPTQPTNIERVARLEALMSMCSKTIEKLGHVLRSRHVNESTASGGGGERSSLSTPEIELYDAPPSAVALIVDPQAIANAKREARYSYNAAIAGSSGGGGGDEHDARAAGSFGDYSSAAYAVPTSTSAFNDFDPGAYWATPPTIISSSAKPPRATLREQTSLALMSTMAGSSSNTPQTLGISEATPLATMFMLNSAIEVGDF